MKTAISIPDSLFQAAEDLAHRLGLARSELYARAIEHFVKRHRRSGVREALDRVYSGEPSELDPFLAAMQAASIGTEKEE
jgi:predicted transcriptional regulator